MCPACLRQSGECRCSHYCAECGCETNHTSRQHRQAEAEMEGREP
jgi:hypothetical protein